MKVLLTYFFLLLISISFYGQNSIISKYEKADIVYEGKSYAEMLGVDPFKTLILKLDDYSFIVFEENDSIFSYQTSSDHKTVHKHKIGYSNYLECLKYLDSLKTIDPSKLNFFTKKNKYSKRYC